MAMTREQICIEQSNFNQARAASGRGVNVWLPCGSRDDEWVLHCLNAKAETGDGVTAWALGETYVARCKPGSYIWPLVADAATAFPGGNWSDVQVTTTGLTQWRYIGNRTITARNMRLTVPADTTRLYMIGMTHDDFGTMNVTKVSGDGDIVKASWNLKNNDAGCDFPNRDNGGGPTYRGSIQLLATNCGGAVLNFIGNGSTPDAIGVAGFIRINDNGDTDEANPLDGVFDPDTIVEVMPYEPSGARLQLAEGPLSLKVDTGTPFWWGLQHWDDLAGIHTLDSEAQSLYYQAEADNSWNVFDPAADTHVRIKALSFGRVLTGNMIIQTAGPVNNTVGTYTAIYSFNPSGVTVTLDHLFNATAASIDLKLAGSATAGVIGGYAGQWAIIKGFAKKIRCYPSRDRDGAYTINTGDFINNTPAFSAIGTQVSLYGNAYEAHIMGEGTLLKGGVNLNSTPSFQDVERADTRQWHKIYFSNAYGTGDIAIADGDRVTGRHVRMVTPKGGLDTGTRGGSTLDRIYR